MEQTLGGFAVGTRFWDREDDMRLFIEGIDEGTHQLLVAQRRMGKTSLMKEAARRLADRYIGLYVDLQGAMEAPDAIAKLSMATYPYKSIWKKIPDIFSNVFKSIKNAIDKVSVWELSLTLRAGLTSGNWQAKGDELLAILAGSEKPVLLLLDEVPIMVNRMLKGDDFTITPGRRRQVDEFVSWLRRNSIEHQGKIRMVLSGSIGFEPVLHQAGLSAAINTFHPFELKPWDDSTAVACLDALASEYGIQFENDAQHEMVRMLGCCIPDHVQMFFGHVHDHCVRNGRMDFPKEEVEKVYQSEMLGVRGHAELTHYEERLKLVLGLELLPLALDMLSEAAVAGNLGPQVLATLQKDYPFPNRATGEAVQEILRVLEHDGYLRRTPTGSVFVSNLLRDWWRKRYELFFTPVAQRAERP